MPSQQQSRSRRGSQAAQEPSSSSEQQVSSPEYPSTPENRALPPVNIPPRPKGGAPVQEGPLSPIHGMIESMIRQRRSRMDSGFASRGPSMDGRPTDKKSVASTSSASKEPPKTPTKNNAAYRQENQGDSASPKCPSIDRTRRQNEKYPPLTEQSPRRTVAGPLLFGPRLPKPRDGLDESMDSDDEES